MVGVAYVFWAIYGRLETLDVSRMNYQGTLWNIDEEIRTIMISDKEICCRMTNTSTERQVSLKLVEDVNGRMY